MVRQVISRSLERERISNNFNVTTIVNRLFAGLIAA